MYDNVYSSLPISFNGIEKIANIPVFNYKNAILNHHWLSPGPAKKQPSILNNFQS